MHRSISYKVKHIILLYNTYLQFFMSNAYLFSEMECTCGQQYNTLLRRHVLYIHVHAYLIFIEKPPTFSKILSSILQTLQ